MTATKGTMLGRLGWHGQCYCCNGPRSKRQVKAEEERCWRSEVADETCYYPVTGVDQEEH